MNPHRLLILIVAASLALGSCVFVTAPDAGTTASSVGGSASTPSADAATGAIKERSKPKSNP